MGTISDKLTYLNTTKSQLKDMINYGLDEENKITSSTTFREYVTSIFNAFLEALRTPDTLFTNLPKKSGTGANITLNDTANAPMRIIPKSTPITQETTTGKNMIDYITNLNTNYRGLTSVINADGSITATGIPDSNYISIIRYEITNLLENGVTYTLSQKDLHNSILYLQINITDNGGGATQYASLYNQTSATFTADTVNKKYILNLQTGTTTSWGSSSRTITNFYQLEKGSSATSFEKFTGGIPAPNSSYKEDLHTISGSNTLKVEGRNIFIPTLKVGTTSLLVNNGTLTLNDDEYTLTATGSDAYFGNIGSAGINYKERNGILYDVEGVTNLTCSITNTAFDKNYVGYYNENLISLGFAQINSSTKLITPIAGTKYITIRLGVSDSVSGTSYSTKVQLEYGNVAHDYTPYVLETASINLGKNKLIFLQYNLTQINIGGTWDYNVYTYNGVSYTINNDGTIKLNGTSTNTTYINLYNNSGKKMISNTDMTYTFSKGVSNNNIILAIYEYISGTGWQSLKYVTTDSVQFTPTGNETGQMFRFAINSGVTFNNVILYPMVVEGTEVGEYEPYIEPIECGSIGNYENIPIRTFGMNLFLDSFIPEPNQNINAKLKAGTYTLATCDSNNFGTNVYFKLYKNNVAITTSGHLTGTNTTLNFSTSSYNYYGGNDTSYITFTIDDDYDIAIGLLSSTETRQVMLTNGSEIVRTYEPYGNGTWYLKQELGKVVLDGSENVVREGTSNNNYRFDIQSSIPFNAGSGSNYTPNLLCNRLFAKTRTETYTENQGMAVYLYSGTTYLQVYIEDTKQMSVADFKTWLSTHNLEVCCDLATPTYTPITGTLAEQLENVYQMLKSYKGQTNISQVNDDLSFNLSVQAIESLE